MHIISSVFEIEDKQISNHENSLLVNKSVEVSNSMYASPMLWVPLSCLIAVLFAVENNIVSLISHYGFHSRTIQAPGSLLANFTALVLISYHDREKGYFSWFHTIYFTDISETESDNKDHVEEMQEVESERVVKPRYTLNWTRIYVTLIMCILAIFQYWIFTLSYYYASLANLNNGVIMSLFALKPIINSFAFHFCFSQKLHKFEIVGVFM